MSLDAQLCMHEAWGIPHRLQVLHSVSVLNHRNDEEDTFYKGGEVTIIFIAKYLEFPR